MKRFVVYDAATGRVLRSGTCQDDDLAIQASQAAGEAVMEITVECIRVAEVDLDAVRGSLYAKIDAAAEEVRARFVTPGSAQAMIYLKKEAEARAVVWGQSKPTPFLDAEAAATGVTVADLAALVVTKAEAWDAKAAQIEALRRAAKAAVAQADNIAAMHTAAQVNWAEAEA
jgi:D-alanyl-D-alanine dipeptidase